MNGGDVIDGRSLSVARITWGRRRRSRVSFGCGSQWKRCAMAHRGPSSDDAIVVVKTGGGGGGCFSSVDDLTNEGEGRGQRKRTKRASFLDTRPRVSL